MGDYSDLCKRLRERYRILPSSPDIGVLPVCLEAAHAIVALTAERDALQSQVADLKALVVTIRDERDALSGTPLNPNAAQAVIEERDALKAECERLRKDAERLDWLDAVNRRTNERNGTVYGWRYDINHNRASLSDHHHPHMTAREAIDAAMQDGK